MISDEAESLISHLSGPLTPAARRAFRAAAEAAVAKIQCSGPGSTYREIAAIQRNFFVPVDEYKAAWDIGHEIFRNNKLRDKPAIAEDVDGRILRYRKQPQTV
jgi:hypothetical protein